MINYKMIGKRIKKARINASFTQEQLSELLSVSVEHLSRIETGSARPSLPLLEKIAEILKTEEAQLMFGTQNEIIDDLETYKKIIMLDKSKKIALNIIIDAVSDI